MIFSNSVPNKKIENFYSMEETISRSTTAKTEDMKSQWKYYQIVAPESNQKNWADCIKQIAVVNSYPELLYTLDKTSEFGFENFNDLNFFKDNIKPMWEEQVNKNGGRIIMEIPMSQKDIVFEIWRRTVTFCAKEVFNSVNGCVYAEKANFRICIWIGDSNFADDITNAWKKVLDYDQGTFVYSSHDKTSELSKKGRKYTHRGRN